MVYIEYEDEFQLNEKVLFITFENNKLEKTIFKLKVQFLVLNEQLINDSVFF